MYFLTEVFMYLKKKCMYFKRIVRTCLGIYFKKLNIYPKMKSKNIKNNGNKNKN